MNGMNAMTGPAEIFQVPLPGPTEPNPTVLFSTTEGDFEAEIYLDRVPITASNFIALCRTGFYDGLHFHRVIAGFMIQFGCPFSKDPSSPKAGQGNAPEVSFTNLRNGGLTMRFPGGAIRDEHTSRDSNVPGSLSMANVGRPNTCSSQIFLNVGDNTSLDWFSPGTSQHPVFGMIRKGMEIVNKMSGVPTENDKPLVPIRVIKVTVSGAPDAKESKRKAASSSSSSSSRDKRASKKKEAKKRRSSSREKRQSKREPKKSSAKKKRKKSSSSSSSSSRQQRNGKRRR